MQMYPSRNRNLLRTGKYVGKSLTKAVHLIRSVLLACSEKEFAFNLTADIFYLGKLKRNAEWQSNY